MFIKNIIYINLEHRTDRLLQIQEELNKLDETGEKFNIERFNGIKWEPGIIGCGMSHLNSLKYARDNGYPFVWIIEDDFTFTEDIKNVYAVFEKLTDLIINRNEKIDVLFCAYYFTDGEPYISNDGSPVDYLIKVKECQTASSYIVRCDYYDKLIEHMENGLNMLIESEGYMHHLYANDQYWKILQRTDNWACINPRFGKQRGSYSDNSKCYMDYDV